jgi:hypothetical protein
MVWIRVGERRSARRTAVVDGYQFPAGVRHRFAEQRGGLGADDVRLVEAATRQWFRLVVRHPRARMSMPSVVVDDLWHELVLHTREYEAFCDRAFGRFLHHEPEPSGGTTDGFAARLLVTLDLARLDEACGPADLPLLFRIDKALDVPGGRRYLADCGGRGQCHGASGMICLAHLRGPGKPLKGSGPRREPPAVYQDLGGGGGCGGGCGN